jgi:hypothetical protein
MPKSAPAQRADLSAKPVILTPLMPDIVLPPDRRFWITGDMLAFTRTGSPRPWFNTHTVATVFLGYSAAWLRQRMRASDDYPLSMLVLDGQPVSIHRSKSDDRQFSLAAIERSAHALYEAGQLTDDRFAAAVMMVLWCARQYGILAADHA